MENSSNLKNELIFSYAAGTASINKSLLAATYLFLNSNERKVFSFFEGLCGSTLNDYQKIKPKNLTAEDCMVENKPSQSKSEIKNIDINGPLGNFIDSYNKINWKKVFKGFDEYEFNVSPSEKAKLIKLAPNTRIPLHSHQGQEYVLVLEGSFKDEFGTYKKGDLQINDLKIKHTPVSCPINGCICLSIVENDLIFYGPFAPILNIITFLKSFFSFNK
jgi:putative transcriptional regulator